MAEALLIVPRLEWGARPATRRPFTQAANDRWGWVLHYPGADQFIRDHFDCPERVRAFQRYHMDTKAWSDVAYSFALCPHGVVYELRGWEWDQFATSPETNVNRPHYTVCVMTDLSGAPSLAQIAALNRLIQMGRDRGCGLGVEPHSSLQTTACPGPWLREYAREVSGRPLVWPAEPAEVEEEEVQAVIYKDARYANLWLVGPGGAVHLSPNLAHHYLVVVKVPMVVDQHAQALKSIMHNAGTHESELVPA